jgi:hypothetical protein
VWLATYNNMFALWPGDQLSFSIFIKTTFGFHAKRVAGSGTTRGFEKAPLQKHKRYRSGKKTNHNVTMV